MRRRSKGLLATVREAVRRWWRSKNGDTSEPEAEDTGSDHDTDAAGPRKKVSVQSPLQEKALSMAARGDVFSFQVFPTFRWSSREMPRDTLKTRVGQHEQTAREELLRVAWTAARACAPDDPIEAEQAINDRLSEDGNWCFDDAEGLIRCTPSVRVRVDPEVREHVLKHHLEELTLKETQRVGELRAKRAQELTETWLEVIKNLERFEKLDEHKRRLLVPFAATFADEGFHVVMSALRKDRLTSVEALLHALEGASSAHQRSGMYEFAAAYDTAINAFRREMGLSPGSWVDDVVMAEGPEL
ncbi:MULTISPECIES: hypothetical protein [unclassified Streptomyces]|uniref:hypothetical protein n=1 Tax=unclassified Streptomyces TaxID=2593676 RepID=UPI002E289833|nr:hypothetical protein [Streptomyces sp. NBC_01439]